MQVTFNARERTLREFAALALTAGWCIDRVVRTECSTVGYITAVPVDIPSSGLVVLRGMTPSAPPLPGPCHPPCRLCTQPPLTPRVRAVQKDPFGTQHSVPWVGRNASDSRLDVRFGETTLRGSPRRDRDGCGSNASTVKKKPSGLFGESRSRSESLVPASPSMPVSMPPVLSGAKSESRPVKALKRVLSRVQLGTMGRSEKKEKERERVERM